jgi:hypothetical protein
MCFKGVEEYKYFCLQNELNSSHLLPTHFLATEQKSVHLELRVIYSFKYLSSFSLKKILIHQSSHVSKNCPWLLTNNRPALNTYLTDNIKPLAPELNYFAQSCLPKFLLGILIFKGRIARSLYKSFGVNGLTLRSSFLLDVRQTLVGSYLPMFPGSLSVQFRVSDSYLHAAVV